MKKVMRWIMNAILLPLDYFASGILWQHPGITISARCGEELIFNRQGIKPYLLRLLGKLLNKIDDNHCFKAIEGDKRRILRSLERLNKSIPS